MLTDAQQSSEIVLGRLLVCLVPATVLFDSGASHSFICSAFAMSLDLLREQLPRPLSVCSPGSRVESSRVVPDVEIRIQGVVFIAFLIVFPRSYIDVLLGMDWLVQHKANINSPTRPVKLTHASGAEVLTLVAL